MNNKQHNSATCGCSLWVENWIDDHDKTQWNVRRQVMWYQIKWITLTAGNTNAHMHYTAAHNYQPHG